jgi:thioredoxin-related protein
MPKHDLQCLKFRLNWRHQLLTIFVFLLTTACNPRSKYYPQCESKPKYYNSFKLPNRLVGYNNYDQARLCAKKNNKPLAIYFTGYACVNCEAFENDFLNAASVASHLNNHFYFCSTLC